MNACGTTPVGHAATPEPSRAPPRSSTPIALALFRVNHPDDWTGIESALIRLEAVMTRNNGWLFRFHDLLYLYFAVGDPGPDHRSLRVDARRLEAAFHCVEGLAATLDQHGGAGAVMALGRGTTERFRGSCDALAETRQQLDRATGPSFYVSDEILRYLPTSRSRPFRRSGSTRPGFRQQIKGPLALHTTLVHELRFLVHELRKAGASGFRSSLVWKPLLLAIPGIAMFLLSPYVLDLPATEDAGENGDSYALMGGSRIAVSSALSHSMPWWHDEGVLPRRPGLEPASTSIQAAAVDQCRPPEVEPMEGLECSLGGQMEAPVQAVPLR